MLTKLSEKHNREFFTRRSDVCNTKSEKEKAPGIDCITAEIIQAAEKNVSANGAKTL